MTNWLEVLGFQAALPPNISAATTETPIPEIHRAIARELAGTRIAHAQPSETSVYNIDFPIEPISADDRLRDLALDGETMARLAPAQLLELLCDVSPDISRALWDFLRFCNPGYECKALVKGKPANDTIQAALDALIDKMKTRHGSFDIILSRLFTGAFLRGAFVAELILNKTGKEMLDIATPDPASMRFKQRNDPDYGTTWELGQWQFGKWVSLEKYDTIRYMPIDPLPGSPYGRAIAAPALFTTVFLLGLMHDLRRVVAQQGYPRIDLSINMEKLFALMPENIQDDPEAQRAWLNAMITEIKDVYASLEPDDAYVHSDVITVGRPVGAVDSSSLGAISGIIQNLERQMVRALKTMPLLMGITDGVSEANANRQWEMHAAGIKSIQHLAESLLEHLLGIALRVQGVPASVKFRFSEIRAAEQFRDAQTEQLKIQNANAKKQAGWITQDEASNEVTGHDAAEDEPIQQPQAAPVVVPVPVPVTPNGSEQSQSGDSTQNADLNGEQKSAHEDAKRIAAALDELRASRNDLLLALERMVELV